MTMGTAIDRGDIDDIVDIVDSVFLQEVQGLNSTARL